MFNLVDNSNHSNLDQMISDMLDHDALRNNLLPQDAQRIVEWAASVLASHSMNTFFLREDGGIEYLKQKAIDVHVIMETVNEIVGYKNDPSPPSETALRFLFHDILSSMYLLTGKRTNPFQVKRAIQVARTFDQLSVTQLFAETFAMIENTREATVSSDC